MQEFEEYKEFKEFKEKFTRGILRAESGCCKGGTSGNRRLKSFTATALE
jgi:hypothetical protein